jgi:D-arabinono-1,4-lactone oxidase/FAD binding domain
MRTTAVKKFMTTDTLDLKVDEQGFYHPSSEEQICELIRRANRDGLQIRIRGSGHSVNAAIHTDGFRKDPAKKSGIDVMLDRLSAVTFNDAKKQVTVGAGCHLGKDPNDPNGTSTDENSLFYQLDRKGWAIPDMGGVTHQTVGGFMSTGSSGGSVRNSFGEHIIAIRLIDGRGVVHSLREAAAPEMFYAAGVSLGLLGVITSVTFQCVDRFNIVGQEAITKYEDCEIDLFGPGRYGKPSLQAFLTNTPYARLMWWPQDGVERVALWQAQAIDPTEDFHPKPYEEFPRTLNSTLAVQAAGCAIYTLIGRWPERLKWILKAINYPTVVLPKILSLFVQLDGEKGPQQFRDTWWHGLPMDNQVSGKLFPTEFTEIWVPISRTEEVMRAMKNHYREKGIEATGSFACEIYAAKGSKFWISPSFGEDAVRVNLFWFGYNKGNPTKYYRQFWELLKEFNFRVHWGKHLPDDSTGAWTKYLSQQYPRWKDFMGLREEMDPNQIFVTEYWKRHLGITPIGARVIQSVAVKTYRGVQNESVA